MRVSVGSLSIVSIILVALFATSTSQAHHSYAPYDIRNSIELPGVAESFVFRAPHPRLLLKDAEGVEWDIEVPIMFWRRAEYPEDAIKAGDELVITGFPARDGSPKMALAGFEVNGTYYPVHENIRQRTAVEAAERIEAGEDLEEVLADYPEPEPGTFGQGNGGMGMGAMGMGMAAASDEAPDEDTTSEEE